MGVRHVIAPCVSIASTASARSYTRRFGNLQLTDHGLDRVLAAVARRARRCSADRISSSVTSRARRCALQHDHVLATRRRVHAGARSRRRANRATPTRTSSSARGPRRPRRSPPHAAARSSTVRSTRCGASYITVVRGSAAIAARRTARSRPDRGTKPSNTNRVVSKPLTTRAITNAAGPGTADTAWPASSTTRTSRDPGSEIPGVPASVISVTVSPRRAAPAPHERARLLCARCTRRAERR